MAVENFMGALRAYLLSDSTIAGYVGERVDDPPAPQDEDLPYIVIQKISKTTIDNLNDTNNAVTDRWQVDVYSDDIDDAGAIALAVHSKLHLKNHETWSGYKVYKSKFSNENYMPEPANNASEKVTHRIQQDFLIKHQRTI